MINIVVAGASGRMGSLIVKLIEGEADMAVSGKADIDAPLIHVIDKADVVIDFTQASAAANHAQLSADRLKPMVIGTTGLDADQQKVVRDASQRIPIVHAPNMSLGVNVLFHLITTAARTLGKDFRVEIQETHHTKKLDRPSGTAKRMQDIVAAARQEDRDRIKIVSFREGDVVGDHSIVFTSDEEVLKLYHSALTRELFARGALVATRWVIDKEPGLYDMSDVLNLR